METREEIKKRLAGEGKNSRRNVYKEVVACRKYIIEDFIETDTIGTEIGVAYGDFSKAILTYGKPKCLYLIDPWKSDEIYKEVEKRFSSQIKKNQVVLLRGTGEEYKNHFSKGNSRKRGSLAEYLPLLCSKI